jgi:hypothetical protein
MRRAVNAKRGATAAAADANDRMQMVADTLQQLQLREQRVQDVERCASASYIFVMDLLQARRPPPLPVLPVCKCRAGADLEVRAEARAAGADGGGDKRGDVTRGVARALFEFGLCVWGGNAVCSGHPLLYPAAERRGCC